MNIFKGDLDLDLIVIYIVQLYFLILTFHHMIKFGHQMILMYL